MFSTHSQKKKSQNINSVKHYEEMEEVFFSISYYQENMDESVDLYENVPGQLPVRMGQAEITEMGNRLKHLFFINPTKVLTLEYSFRYMIISVQVLNVLWNMKLVCV